MEAEEAIKLEHNEAAFTVCRIAYPRSPKDTYLTTREFLTNNRQAEYFALSSYSFTALNQDDFDYYKRLTCPDCQNHPDLPLIALKELI